MQWFNAIGNDFKYGFLKNITKADIALAVLMAGLLLITLFSPGIARWFKKDKEAAQSLSLWIKSAALALAVAAAVMITQF